jgi:hypothetical protein
MLRVILIIVIIAIIADRHSVEAPRLHRAQDGALPLVESEHKMVLRETNFAMCASYVSVG